MAQTDRPLRESASPTENGNNNLHGLWRRIFARDSTATGMPDPLSKEQGSHSDDDTGPGLIRRVSRKVVPGLPRVQTFKRQQSEVRNKLEPVQPTPAERRAVSVDRRYQSPLSGSQTHSNPRSSAPDFASRPSSAVPFASSALSVPVGSLEEATLAGRLSLAPSLGLPDIRDVLHAEEGHDSFPDAVSETDCRSMTTSHYDALIHEELERTWILNLSMHFRDKSKREKFFVTYRERPTLWRRVTISVDYRDAPENSLELELAHTRYQRDKIAKIYDAIRESLIDIQFYPTVTNLKLQTTEGRLHVHVVEDVNEIIHYPSTRTIQHMMCNRVKERDIEFDSHISGFVYKVRVNEEVLIKKEIPGPDTVDEFLYEINALSCLKHSKHVIRFHGVVVDDTEEHVKGLLISHAEQGALIDIIYDQIRPLPWSLREKWARQIVSGLSEIHEAGFVQGDFTLSNIVIDSEDNAKIIDINRRGCPVGWEPPEATPLIESNQRISMYIGVKSDLYQLGMVLWALAMEEDEPEAHGRPLRWGADPLDVPRWFRRLVDICLSEDPRGRMPALQLLSLFPDIDADSDVDRPYDQPSISVDDGLTRKEYFLAPETTSNEYPRIRTVHPSKDWSYISGWGHSYVNSPKSGNDESFFYPTRGRSPPSPLPSNPGECESPKYGYRTAARESTSGSVRTSDYERDVENREEANGAKRSMTPRGSLLSMDRAGTFGEVNLGQDYKVSELVSSGQETATYIASEVGLTMKTSTEPSVELDRLEEPPWTQSSKQFEVLENDHSREFANISHSLGAAKHRLPETFNSTGFTPGALVETDNDEQTHRLSHHPPELGATEPDMAENSSKIKGQECQRDVAIHHTEEYATGFDVPPVHQASDAVKPTTAESSELTVVETAEHAIRDGLHRFGQVKEIMGANSESWNVTASDGSTSLQRLEASTEQPTSGAAVTDPGELPHELKGVGSTHNTEPESLHTTRANHDLEAFIDAELASYPKEEGGGDDTTVLEHAGL